MENVFAFFKSLGEKIEAALVKVFGQAALNNVEAQIKTIFSDDVRVIFVDAVNAAESLEVGGSPASSSAKRQAAFEQIETDLAAKSISLAENVINLGIELVVGLLKSKTPA